MKQCHNCKHWLRDSYESSDVKDERPCEQMQGSGLVLAYCDGGRVYADGIDTKPEFCCVLWESRESF